MEETFKPVILRRKAARARKQKGDDGPRIQAQASNQDRTSNELLKRAVVRPIRILLFSPIVLLLSIYGSFLFGLIYLLFTTFPDVFGVTYEFTAGTSGLSYLGLGMGMILGILLFGILSDKILKQPRGGTVVRPELRLILMIYAAPFIPIGFFWYGWSADKHTHWIVPILGTFIIGCAGFLMMMPGQLYLVDAFGSEAAASALAGSTVSRSLFAALLPLAGPHLYSALGLGWGNSLLAFVALAFVPVPFLLYRYGEQLRTRFPVKL